MNIQCVAHGIVHHNERILVYNVIDKSSKKSFYRSIGGHVEFGESSSDTLIREFKEEINEGISVFKKLGTYENIFNYKGKTMHEYVTISLVNFNSLILVAITLALDLFSLSFFITHGFGENIIKHLAWRYGKLKYIVDIHWK